MSTWRDIWRYGVIANRFYSENEDKGERAFAKLKEVYDKPEKDEYDGMIRYIMAEAYELRYHLSNNQELKDKALSHYQEAEQLFPVDHWKAVANKSFTRLQTDKKLQEFYNIKIKRDPIEIYADFNDLLWYGFQKVYTFTHLNDFARYISLSALARGDSEWPLSLVDFRTVLELEIKQCFPDIINNNFDDKHNRYSLYKIIEELKKRNLINEEQKKAFHFIRQAGNIAAHELYPDEKYSKENIVRFIDVLTFFNDYRRSSSNSILHKTPYPLCQIKIEHFLLLPDDKLIRDRIEKEQNQS